MDYSAHRDILSDIERRPVVQRHFSISEAMGKMYKNTEQTPSQENVKSMGDYIRFTNEGIPTKAEQLKRDRKLYEANGFPVEQSPSSEATLQGEVVGTVESHRPSKQRKGISVSFVNGQIVLDRSSINRQVDQFDANDSDDEQELSDLVDRPYRQRKHKVVSWSVEETRQFYECLRRFGTDFFMMNKVITNRSRKDLKNKFKTEEKRNPRLVSLTLAVHLKEKVNVPEVPQGENEQGKQEDAEDLVGSIRPIDPLGAIESLDGTDHENPVPSEHPTNSIKSVNHTASSKDDTLHGIELKEVHSDDDADVPIEGALSESSEEDSDDSMILQDLL